MCGLIYLYLDSYYLVSSHLSFRSVKLAMESEEDDHDIYVFRNSEEILFTDSSSEVCVLKCSTLHCVSTVCCRRKTDTGWCFRKFIISTIIWFYACHLEHLCCILCMLLNIVMSTKLGIIIDTIYNLLLDQLGLLRRFRNFLLHKIQAASEGLCWDMYT